MNFNLLSCITVVALILSGVAVMVNGSSSAERITDYVRGAAATASPAVLAHNNNNNDGSDADDEISSSAPTRVTGSEGPLRIRVSGIQNKQATSAEIDRVEDGAFVATTTAAPFRDVASSAQSRNPEEEEIVRSPKQSQEVSSSSTMEQLGQAIKFIGTFVSWARAINPATPTTISAAEDEYARSNAAFGGSDAGERAEQLRKELIGAPRVDSDSVSSSTEVAEGRYLKGDPLKGYYDFVITEGSYKFWAVFQLATAALIIYSTFAAIYYSKVNPLTSDYDYVDYFGGRALGSSNGRSLSDLDNTDVVDDDADDDEEDEQQADVDEGQQFKLPGQTKSGRRNATSSTAEEDSENRSFLSGWTSMFEGGRRGWWIDTAASGFHFVLDAIDKIPQ